MIFASEAFNSHEKVDCLILAAGNSSRFGGCKLLAGWQGQPLIAATIAAARAIEPARITVVAGAFYSQLSQAKKVFDTGAPEIELLQCEDWQLGMGHSLAFGIEHLKNLEDVAEHNAVLILLGDQPLVTAQDLQQLHRAWRESPTKIVCASFADTLGVPAIFPAQFKTELLTCTGDRGAKNLLARYKEELITVPMASAEFDVDTPSDLNDLLKKYSNIC